MSRRRFNCGMTTVEKLFADGMRSDLVYFLQTWEADLEITELEQPDLIMWGDDPNGKTEFGNGRFIVRTSHGDRVVDPTATVIAYPS